MKKKCYILMSIVMTLIGTSFASCSGSDSAGDGPNGSGEAGLWYTSRLITQFHEDDPYILEHIDQFFDSEGRYGGELVFPGNLISHGPAGYKEEIEVIHLINNTLEVYYGYLYKYGSSGTRGKKLLYRITGSAIGDVAYYASSPTTTTYTREGNVISFVWEGEKTSLTITNNALLGDDGDKWISFNIGQTFNDNFKPVDVSEEEVDARTISKSVTVVGTPTFHKVNFKCTFGTSNNGKTYTRVFAFSKNRADLEDSDQLGKRYFNLTGIRTVNYPPNYTTNLNTVMAIGDNGYLEDGDLRFADEQTADLNDFTAVYDELGVTIYYCPVIIVANNNAVMGDIKSVTMRKLNQTSGFVDLGLSCLWSATNEHASQPWDLGYSMALFDKNVKNGGRMPTKDEAMELNRCQLEVIDNGILVTGLNGNQIFIPYRDTQSGWIYPGYGTSSSQYSSGRERDVLFNYNQSQNRFTTSTASERHSTAYVRAVKSGGGGGTGVDANALLLKKLLQSPLMIEGLDLAMPIYNKLHEALAPYYVFESGCWGNPNYWGYISINANQNPGLNIIYRDMNFTDMYLSESINESYSQTYYHYNFLINKSILPDPVVMGRLIVQDFNNIGIPVILDEGNHSGSYDTYSGSNESYRSYYINWYTDENYEQTWRFNISVSYYRY